MVTGNYQVAMQKLRTNMSQFILKKENKKEAGVLGNHMRENLDPN